MASPSLVKMRPRPVAAMVSPAASASSAFSPGINVRVARFTKALRSAKSLSLRLRAAARRTERPKAIAHYVATGLTRCRGDGTLSELANPFASDVSHAHDIPPRSDYGDCSAVANGP